MRPPACTTISYSLKKNYKLLVIQVSGLQIKICSPLTSLSLHLANCPTDKPQGLNSEARHKNIAEHI